MSDDWVPGQYGGLVYLARPLTWVLDQTAHVLDLLVHRHRAT